MAAMDDDAPLTSAATMVIEIDNRQNGSQVTVGVAVWRPRQAPVDGDNQPLEAKRHVPSHSITVYEFADEERFLNLDSLIIREKPKWCFLNPSLPEARAGAVQEILRRNECEVADPVKGSAQFRWPTDAQKRQGVESELAAVLNESDLNAHNAVLGMRVALNALMCLMTEMRPVGLMRAAVDGDVAMGEGGEDDALPSMNFHELHAGSLGTYLRMDSAAADAVMLLPDRNAPQQANGSLYGILNHCKTKMGSRLLEAWLRQPLVDLDAINERYDFVDLFKEHASLRGDLMNSLHTSPDLEQLVARLRRSRANLHDVYRLYHFAIGALPQFISVLKEWLAENEGMPSAAIEKLGARHLGALEQADTDFTNFKGLVDHVLDLSDLPDIRIKPQHAPALGELSEQLETCKVAIKEAHEAVEDEWERVKAKSGASVRLEQHKEHGWIMRLPNCNDEQRLRKELPQVSIISLLKNGVYFTTDDLRDAAAEYHSIISEYEEEQKVVADKVIATASTYVPVAEAVARVAAEMDVLLSFAHVAAHCPTGDYVRPHLYRADDAEAKIHLVGARHPCVELQEGVTFIPNDYAFARESSCFQIVTGPNMGGKSTFIRGLGTIIAMAQAGSFVPCTEAELPIVDTILARVGAGDAATRGLSTFMAEMIEASTIVRTATKNSLVIIDELGRGTSTFDGFGLAWSISEYMVKRIGCWTLFATHFHELTALADQEASVINRHVSAHVEDGNVTFLYEVRPGPCLQSFGIHVAEMAHFPKETVECARRKAAELEHYDTASAVKRQKTNAGGSAAGVST